MDDQRSEFTKVAMSSLSQPTVGMVFPRVGLPGRLRHNLSSEGKDPHIWVSKGRVLHFRPCDLKKLHRIFASRLPCL